MQALANWNSKKLGALAGIVATIMQVEVDGVWKVAAIAGAAVGYFLSDAWQNRATKAAEGLTEGVKLGREAK
jgi:hypothetical protein